MIRAQVVTESWRPTLRATPLRPLVVVTGGLIVIAIVASWRSARAPDLFGIGAAALAAAVALGLDDEPTLDDGYLLIATEDGVRT